MTTPTLVAGPAEPPLAAPLAKHWQARRSSRLTGNAAASESHDRPTWCATAETLAQQRNGRKQAWSNAFGGLGDDIALRQSLQAATAHQPTGVAFHVELSC